MIKLFIAIIFFFSSPSSFGFTSLLWTHQVDFGGEISYERHKVWKHGPDEYAEVCSREAGCFRSTETPYLSITNFGGQIHEIRKGKQSGISIYHNMLGKKLYWDVYKNGKKVGILTVTYVKILDTGVRVYEDTLNVPGIKASSTTSFDGKDILSQSGQVNDIKFSVQKIFPV